jgi:hypothetical protein
MPKGAMRILQGAKIQAEFHEKKRQREAEEAKKMKKRATDASSLQIMDGEKLGDFHRRVEKVMAKDINSTIKATKESSKKRKRQVESGLNDEYSETKGAKSKVEVKEANAKDLKRERELLQAKADKPIDFQRAETRKRVNDVVLAPPVLTKAPRGESKQAKERKATLKSLMTGQKAVSTVSSARLPDPIQKSGGLKREAMLQEERDRVVQAYRNKNQADLHSRR